MYLSNYKFFTNNILRGMMIRKYGYKNCMALPELNRIVVTLELKDKEDSVSFDNFLALNILTHVVKTKSGCVAHSARYKFGQKHTFVFQSTLRGYSLDSFLNFFCLNSLFLINKKQLDFQFFTNAPHHNSLIAAKDVSFFSQLPVEYFKWDSGIKIELSSRCLKSNNFNMSDLTCFLNFLGGANKNEKLIKNIFYHEVFNYKG